ncbi:MAG: ferrous iron transport protein A [Clostridia bacterium]|nr:ferrous iron transport protein A [Clostridia bacterium]
MSSRTLNMLRVGESAFVLGIDEKSGMKRRLSDLGFTQKTEVECTLISPLGDPKAFLIKNTVIALREDDSKFVYIS